MGTAMTRSLRNGLTRRQVMQSGAAVGAGLLMPSAFSALARARQSDQSGTFRAMSWETEAEMRKWQRHLDAFFSANNPNR